MNYSYHQKCMEMLDKCDKLDAELQSRILKLNLTNEIIEGNRKIALMGPKYALLGAIDYGIIENAVDFVSNVRTYNDGIVTMAALTGMTLYNLALLPIIENDASIIKRYVKERKMLKEANK